MNITVEMIDQVKDRTGVSYKEAKEALEKANGNVVDAIIDIEESLGGTKRGDNKEGKAIVEKLKELVKKGNVSRILIKKDGEVIMNLPVNAGIVAGVVAPWASLIGVVAAFGFKCEIEVVKDDGSILDVSEMTNEKIGVAVEKGSVIANELKERGAAVYETVKEKGGEAYEQVKEKAAARKEQFDFDEDDDYTEQDSEVEIDKE